MHPLRLQRDHESTLLSRAIRRALSAQQSSYTVMGAASKVESMLMLDLEERAYGRGAFDT